MAPAQEEKQESKPYYIRVNFSSDEDENIDDYELVVPRPMTDEEYAEYWRQVCDSKGFDVQWFPGTSLPGGIVPRDVHGSYRELMIDLSKHALEDYNGKNNASYDFVDLVKATVQGVAGTMYYITFNAKDTTALSNDPCRTFRAKVWNKLLNRGSEVKFCEII